MGGVTRRRTPPSSWCHHLGKPCAPRELEVNRRDGQAPAAVIKGRGWKVAGVAVAFELIHLAQGHWHADIAPNLVALVCAGAKFENGKLVERPEESGSDAHAA